ncbi:Cysteine desulfurase [Desulfitobacterium hafniense]|uniref:Cysteine desulfurase n=1 Tax=Desulfitobacterium hafniense TaxID=49338 RepID=A0A098AVX3_DESHA|nr:Cysteine desulfurase [Desulfitobacterium hafniense]
MYIRDGLEIEPLLHGASQERGRRAGTENVPYAVALGEAAIQAKAHLKQDTLLQSREYFYNRLKEAFGDKIHLNGDEMNRLPNTLNISFIGSLGSDILAVLPEICASTGSACHSGSKSVSPVLAAMGVEEEIALGAIRFSVGRYTTKLEIDQAVNQLTMYFSNT